MRTDKPKETNKLDRVVAESRRAAEERGHSYREQALKLFPWVCGRCNREFTRKNLSELTVHHKDHNHDNNPTDGSNWELLCVYCHDHEHQKLLVAQGMTGSVSVETKTKPATSKPFAGLKEMMDKK